MNFGLRRVSRVLNWKTDNRLAGCRVSKVRNRVRQPKSLDWVAAGRTGWAGWRFAWTALVETIAVICLNPLETTHNSKSHNEPFVGWENKENFKPLVSSSKKGCILFSILIFYAIHGWKTCIVRFIFCYHFQFQYQKKVRIKTK